MPLFRQRAADVLALRADCDLTEEEANHLLDNEFTVNTIKRTIKIGGRAALGLEPTSPQQQVSPLSFSLQPFTLLFPM